MRAVVVRDWIKDPRELVVSSTEEPIAGPGLVKVKIAAAGINFFDLLMSAGKYQVKPPLPFVLGAEFAGVVTEVGDGADGGFKPGDRVFGGNMIGCFAEYASVDPDNMRRIPSGMSMREAAGLYVTLPTSYAALALRGRLQPGETCLVLGAAGGVGIYAVQIAKAMGAKVIAVAGSKDKLDVCAANGADAGVNYREDDWVKQVKDLTGGRGVDVVYDPVGMPTECTKCMAWKSRYVVVGFAGGDIPKLALNRVLLKQIEVIGLHWGAYEVHEPEAISPTWDACIKLYTEGKIKPAVYPETFPLEKTADALVQVAARKTHGKVIIDVDTTLDSEAARSRL